jgi:hypothetical protein
MAVGAGGIWMYAVIVSVRIEGRVLGGVVGDGCDPGEPTMRRTGGRAGLCGS